MSQLSELRNRFPAIGRLAGVRSRHVPLVEQHHMSDCGAACLTAVLRHFGRELKLMEVRDRFGSGRDGVSAQSILDVAAQFGLRGRAMKLELEDLPRLPIGAILHWKMSHFVVLSRHHSDGIEIMDPARGRHRVHAKELDESFTGVALSFEPSRNFEKRSGDRSPVLAYLKELLLQSGLISRVIVTSILIQLFTLGLPIFTGAVIDRVVPRGDAQLLQIIALGIGMIAVFSLLANLLRAHLLLELQTTLDLKLTMSFVDHLMRLPFSFFQLRRTGDLLMRLHSNATIREMLTTSTVTALLDGSMVTLYLVVLLLTHVPLGLLVLALGLLRVTIFTLSKRRFRELAAEQLQTQAAASDYQVQMLSGIETLKSTGTEARAVQYWSNLFVDVMNVSLARGRVNATVQSLMTVLSIVSPLILLAYGAHLVLTDQLSLGTMLAMNALAAGFLVPLSSLVQTGLQLQTMGSYVDRVDDVLSKKPERDGEKNRPAPDLLGQIELRNIAFRYAEEGPWAVRDVSLVVPSGMRVAIVGRSGSGKSSLARLLVALYPPTQGRILYDGADLLDCDLDSIRRQIGFVPQFPYLFGASIRENIALTDPDAPLESVERAAQLACIHDEILDMPLQYNTPIAAGGGSLAGGQAQRIALARALLRRPPLLVLDEATSHLDAISERSIHENLQTLRCTHIVIAHRLSTIVDSDLILVMENGRIVEEGRHSGLLARGGAYAQLFRNQMKGTHEASAD